MENFSNKDLAAEYLALKAANDQQRERGKQWLWNTLDMLCSEISRELSGKAHQPPLQVGRQEWQYTIENATMIGERFGARNDTRTLVVEVGWPRLPEHGFVPDGGLARARVGISQNVMIEPQIVAEFTLKRQAQGEPSWHVISNKKPGERVTESSLRSYLYLIMTEQS
jgi:hypothetical protein